MTDKQKLLAIEVAYRGYCSELDKIAWHGTEFEEIRGKMLDTLHEIFGVIKDNEGAVDLESALIYNNVFPVKEVCTGTRYEKNELRLYKLVLSRDERFSVVFGSKA